MTKRNNITAHVVCKNEEQWIWYALNSVINYVDKILIFDTGSEDRTVGIIKSIRSPKIVFKQKGQCSASKLTKLRQEQIKQTKTDWFLILDGDEVWPDKTIIETIQLIGRSQNRDRYGVVVGAWNMTGDLAHFHPESEDYQWPYAPPGKKGWMNLRLINSRIPGLHLQRDYPLEAYCDENNTPIQNYGDKKLLFTHNRYFHMTYLPRSTVNEKHVDSLKRGPKKKPEIGRRLPEHIALPEVFSHSRPSIVPDWQIKTKPADKIKAALYTPIKKTKRKLLGYK